MADGICTRRGVVGESLRRADSRAKSPEKLGEVPPFVLSEVSLAPWITELLMVCTSFCHSATLNSLEMNELRLLISISNAKWNA